MKDTFVQDLQTKFKAGYQILVVNTSEEERALQEIRLAGWSMADGRTVLLNVADHKIFSRWFKDDPKLQEQLTADSLIINAEKLLRLHSRLTAESDPNIALLEHLLDSNGYPVVGWELPLGFTPATPGNAFPEAGGLVSAIMACISPYRESPLRDSKNPNILPKNCVVVFKDIHPFLNTGNDPQWRRALRTVFVDNRLADENHRRIIVLLQPEWTPHPDIAHYLHPMEFLPPTEEQLDKEISATEEALHGNKKDVIAVCPPELRRDIVQALRGFTQFEAANAMAYCAVKHKGFTPDMLPSLHKLKAEALKNSEVLEYVDADNIANAEDIGGFENFLDYVAECRECFSDEAITAGLKRSKGALLLGTPGSGKSMVAMATAKLMAKPLVKYDFGAVFGGIVGASEANQRSALKRVQALGPCVLLIDEADKAFANMDNTKGDSGVGQRVFGRLLSWMANENQDAFVIMTMNRTDGVPPEMLRAGRLDAVFYTTLPGEVEREQIFRIHMRKNGVAAEHISQETWAALLELSEDYVGAELEQIVVRAVRSSWKRARTIQPASEDWQRALKTVKPLAKQPGYRAEYEKLTKYCEEQAIRVSSDKPKVQQRAPLMRRGSIDINRHNS